MCPQLKKHPCICVTSYLNSARHQAVSSGKDELFGTSALRWCQEDFACWRAIRCCQDKLLFGHGGVQCRHYLNFLSRLLLSDYLWERKCVCEWASATSMIKCACVCIVCEPVFSAGSCRRGLRWSECAGERCSSLSCLTEMTVPATHTQYIQLHLRVKGNVFPW